MDHDDFYGFHAPPFGKSSGADAFFQSAAHRTALSYLGYALAQAEGFVVVTGDPGTGKSMLAGYLDTMDGGRLTVIRVDAAGLAGRTLAGAAADALGLATDGADPASAARVFERFLHAEACAGRRCLLVVDDAHTLPPAAFAPLCALADTRPGAYPLLQAFLLARSPFRQRLQDDPAMEGVLRRVVAAHHLDPMEPQEVRAYVEHRLARAGWTGRPIFDPQVHAALAAVSHGNFRRIDDVARGLLRRGAAGRHERIGLALLEAEGAGLPCRPAVARSTSRQHSQPKAGRDRMSDALDEAQHRIAALEARTLEQDRTLRQMMSLLIEWIEGDRAPGALA